MLSYLLKKIHKHVLSIKLWLRIMFENVELMRLNSEMIVQQFIYIKLNIGYAL